MVDMNKLVTVFFRDLKPGMIIPGIGHVAEVETRPVFGRDMTRVRFEGVSAMEPGLYEFYADNEIRVGLPVEHPEPEKNPDSFLEQAKIAVINTYNDQHCSRDYSPLTADQVYIVWFAKTLQNWKALLSTDISDGRYYEVTYNGDLGEAYVDTYERIENRSIPLSELV